MYSRKLERSSSYIEAMDSATRGLRENSEKRSDSHDSDSDNEGLSHDELMQVTSSMLAKLLPQDPFLKDLPSGVTVEEVNAQIALQYGRSMTVYVVRGDGEELPVVVPQGTATVKDLKRALQRHMTLRLFRQKSTTRISWTHLWRTCTLSFEGQDVDDDNLLLSSYSIRNRSKVSFNKKYRMKGKVFHNKCSY